VDKEFKNGVTDIDSDYLKMIIENFNDAISKNKPMVYIGYEVIDDDNLKQYNIERKNWKSMLVGVLDAAIKQEEYEYCEELKNIIKIL